jgi:periplasmic divalent cation tolerance protein
MEKALVVYTTVPSKKMGELLAHRLVETRLAACVNIIPHVESIYRWEGKVQTAGEFLLVIKTVESRLTDLIAKIKKLHDYNVPEIVALPVVAGSPEYLNWLQSETTHETQK